MYSRTLWNVIVAVAVAFSTALAVALALMFPVRLARVLRKEGIAAGKTCAQKCQECDACLAQVTIVDNQAGQQSALATAFDAVAPVVAQLAQDAYDARPATRSPPQSGTGRATGGGSTGNVLLPKPSRNDAKCITNMGYDEENAKDCMALVYNKCVPGLDKNDDKVPEYIRSKKSSILNQIYNAAKNEFERKPTNWAAVCVARPDKAGKGNCPHIKKGWFRVWSGVGSKSNCARSGSFYKKTHFDAKGKLLEGSVGTVGHV